MKRFLAIAVAALVIAATTVGWAEPINTPPAVAQQDSPDDHLIVPGERIGRVKLGVNAKNVVAMLGQPVVFDVGRDIAQMGWQSGNRANNGFLGITTTLNYQILSVRVIGDPEYATSQGLRVGIPEKQVRDVLGEPTYTVREMNGGHSLQYSSGVSFGLNYEPGDDYQRVTTIQIVSRNCFSNAPPDICTYLLGYH